MKRRVYLATAAAAALAGCSALTDEPSDDGDDGDDGDDDSPTDTVDEDPGSFDDFEDLSKWTVMEGTLTADEDRVHTGSQSGRMESDGSTDRIMIKREFDSYRDLSTEFPAIAFASDHDVNPTVQLTDADGDRLLLQCSVSAGGPFTHHDHGIVDVVGDPDLSEIEHTKISVWAGDRDLSLWCDDYYFVERPDAGRVTLQFPDESVAIEAGGAVAEYDFPATTFVGTNRVGSEGYPTVEELETLQEYGWTIASKGARGGDLTQFDEGTVADDLDSAATWLADHGFEDAYVSYPLNRYDETTVDLVADRHELAFVSGHAGHGYLSNPHLAPRATNPDADEVDQLLEWSATYGTIVTLSFRTLENLDAVLETIAAHEADGGIEVVGPGVIADAVHD